MARVVLEQGNLVAMEWDFDSITVDLPDREITRAILHWRTDNKDGNNWIGRQLRRYALEAGWQDITIEPKVSVAVDGNTSLAQSLKKAATGAMGAGAITAEECDSWLAEMDQQLEVHQFFASIVYFIIKATK
jgi:hypothetical protein